MIMQFVKNLPTYLLALVYLVFGSNYFLHFIPMPPMEGNAGAFAGLLYSTGFLAFVKVLEVLLGLLLLLPATRRLALLLIAPISVNILLFELFIAHQPGIGILLVLLNGFAIYQHRKSYMPIISAA
jgi:putative oxidoreductase